jgi:hypothetical protein
VRGDQHDMHKPPEQDDCSQAGENESEGSFHKSASYPGEMSFRNWRVHACSNLSIHFAVPTPRLQQ